MVYIFYHNNTYVASVCKYWLFFIYCSESALPILFHKCLRVCLLLIRRWIHTSRRCHLIWRNRQFYPTCTKSSDTLDKKQGYSEVNPVAISLLVYRADASYLWVIRKVIRERHLKKLENSNLYCQWVVLKFANDVNELAGAAQRPPQGHPML